jgi:hypothetical protein
VDIYEVRPRKNKRGAHHLAGILIALDRNNVSDVSSPGLIIFISNGSRGASFSRITFDGVRNLTHVL